MVTGLLLILLLFILAQFLYAWFYMLKGRKLSVKTYVRPVIIKRRGKKTLNIFVDGDSAGAGVGATHFRYTIGGRILAKYTKNHSVVLTNYAISGSKIEDLQEKPLPKQKQDIAVISIGSNDLFYFTSISSFKKTVKKVVKRYSTSAKRVVFLGPLRVDYARSIPLLLKPIYFYRGKRLLNILHNECRNYANVSHTSSYYLSTDQGYGDIESSDGFHPSDEGYEMYTALVFKALDTGHGSKESI